MAVHYRTQGFVLKKNDLREADQVFSIYTQDFGKLKILGKAIRKIKSKLRAGAELFYLSEIEFIQGKTHKTLTDATVIDKFKNTRRDLEKLEIIYQIAETADNLINDQEKDEKIWNLLGEVFNKLKIEKQSSGESASVHSEAVHCELLDPGKATLREVRFASSKIIYYYFLWNLLSILGYQIDFYNCAVCQKKLVPQKLCFNSEEGIICSECSGNLKDKLEISPDVIKILRLFLKRNWQILSRLRITNSHKKELENISENYLSNYKRAV